MSRDPQKYIREIEDLAERYNQISKSINSPSSLRECVHLSLNIFIRVAEISDLPLRRVRLEAVYESVRELAGVLEGARISVPEFGNLEISDTYGTVVFVDITRSKSYFESVDSSGGYIEKENYTGFVIFNSYITLVKSITRLFDGEFLEHTGDGAMLFFEYKDFIDYRNNYYNNPIGLCFLAGEILKKYAKEKGLIDYTSEIIERGSFYKKIRELSLVHIGASYGKVLSVTLGDVNKLISRTVWKAADNCKKAKREVVKVREIYSHPRDKYLELPIKVSG